MNDLRKEAARALDDLRYGGDSEEAYSAIESALLAKLTGPIGKACLRLRQIFRTSHDSSSRALAGLALDALQELEAEVEESHGEE